MDRNGDDIAGRSRDQLTVTLEVSRPEMTALRPHACQKIAHSGVALSMRDGRRICIDPRLCRPSREGSSRRRCRVRRSLSRLGGTCRLPWPVDRHRTKSSGVHGARRATTGGRLHYFRRSTRSKTVLGVRRLFRSVRKRQCWTSPPQGCSQTSRQMEITVSR